jgi:transaldolase
MKINKLKFFIDTADFNLIKKIDFIKIHGITTNPSLAAKSIGNTATNSEKFSKYKEILKNICNEVDGDVSGEVIAINYESMKAEALELAEINKNIVVKLPITRDGLRLCKFLSTEHNIPVNMTLCFSPIQAVLCAMNGAKYVSPFIGRLDDLGINGIQLIRDIKKIFENYGFSTQILAASIRNIGHILESMNVGVDAITIPPSLFDTMYKNLLTDKSLEIFLYDWNK